MKSTWTGVSCHTDRNREAVRTWFAGMADDLRGPTKVNALLRDADDSAVKIRALFEDASGTPKELIRTMGRNFSITIKEPSSQRWV